MPPSLRGRGHLKKPIAMSKVTKRNIYEMGATACNVIAAIIRVIKYPLELACEGLEAMACESNNYASDIRRDLYTEDDAWL